MADEKIVVVKRILTAKAFKNCEDFNLFLEGKIEIKRTYVSMLQAPIDNVYTRIYVVEYYKNIY